MLAILRGRYPECQVEGVFHLNHVEKWFRGLADKEFVVLLKHVTSQLLDHIEFTC